MGCLPGAGDVVQWEEVMERAWRKPRRTGQSFLDKTGGDPYIILSIILDNYNPKDNE